MKYLGIDYGLKKVGLAVSEGETASPYKIIHISSLIDAVNQIISIINKESIDVLVVGLSESGESRNITKKFIEEMRKHDIEIIEVEETLSSKRAIESMVDLGLSQKRRQYDDDYAASLILQEYLDGREKS